MKWFSAPQESAQQPEDMKEKNVRGHVPRPKALNNTLMKKHPHQRAALSLYETPRLVDVPTAFLADPDARITTTKKSNIVVRFRGHNISLAHSPAKFPFLGEDSKELAVIVLHGADPSDRGPLEDEEITDVAVERGDGFMVVARKTFRNWILQHLDRKVAKRALPYRTIFPNGSTCMFTVTLIGTHDIPGAEPLSSFPQ